MKPAHLAPGGGTRTVPVEEPEEGPRTPRVSSAGDGVPRPYEGARTSSTVDDRSKAIAPRARWMGPRMRRVCLRSGALGIPRTVTPGFESDGGFHQDPQRTSGDRRAFCEPRTRRPLGEARVDPPSQRSLGRCRGERFRKGNNG